MRLISGRLVYVDLANYCCCSKNQLSSPVFIQIGRRSEAERSHCFGKYAQQQQKQPTTSTMNDPSDTLESLRGEMAQNLALDSQ